MYLAISTPIYLLTAIIAPVVSSSTATSTTAWDPVIARRTSHMCIMITNGFLRNLLVKRYDGKDNCWMTFVAVLFQPLNRLFVYICVWIQPITLFIHLTSPRFDFGKNSGQYPILSVSHDLYGIFFGLPCPVQKALVRTHSPYLHRLQLAWLAYGVSFSLRLSHVL